MDFLVAVIVVQAYRMSELLGTGLQEFTTGNHNHRRGLAMLRESDNKIRSDAGGFTGSQNQWRVAHHETASRRYCLTILT
jgi:hypothetical protein